MPPFLAAAAAWKADRWRMKKPFGVQHYRLLFLLGSIAVSLLAVLHIGTGTVPLTPAEVIAALLYHPVVPFHFIIVWDLRLPRTLIAIVVGAMLGLAGALLQSVMHNPLTEPEMTGATSGAVLFAVLWLARGPGQLAQPGIDLPLAALVGGVLAGGLVYLLSWQRKTVASRLVLTGVLVSVVLRSCTSVILLLRQESIGSILIWLIGSLDGRVWIHWQMLWPWALFALPLGLGCASRANVLQLGDASATGLGLRVLWSRAVLFFIAIILTASAVAVVGGITFLGLIAPHSARRIVGTDARRLFPFSMLVGAGLLLAADTVAQILSQAVAIPVGAVLALLGAPFFLYLVWRRNL